MSNKYLRNRWYCAAEVKDISRQPLARTLLNEDIVFYRREDGTPVALDNVCAHRRAPLHMGTIEGDNIRCPYHGLMFNSGGACIFVPGQSHVPGAARVRSYPVVDRHGWVWIWMGEAALANEADIPDCHPCADPAWTSIMGSTHLDCDALLVIDNLMDLSHIAYVHKGTIGSTEDTAPDLNWERGPEWVRGTRVAKDLSPTPAHKSFGYDVRRDETKIMLFEPPINITIEIKTTEAGFEFGKGRMAYNVHLYNYITPETDNSCFYFWASTRNWDIDNQTLNDAIRKNSGPLLGEDKAIMEATQRMNERHPHRTLVSFAADTGSVLARRILDRLIAEETNPAANVA